MVPGAGEPSDEAVSDVWYRIDRHDRIVAFGGAWRSTQAGDDTAVVPAADVIGTRIYDHVSGHFTRRFLREFFEQARRQTSTAKRKNYRCDSPGHKVLVEMTACADEGGGIVTTHRDVEVVTMPFNIAIKDVRSRRLASVLRCSMCNRLQSPPGSAWREPEEVAQPDVVTPVFHTVCLDCRMGVAARIGGWHGA